MFAFQLGPGLKRRYLSLMSNLDMICLLATLLTAGTAGSFGYLTIWVGLDLALNMWTMYFRYAFHKDVTLISFKKMEVLIITLEFLPLVVFYNIGFYSSFGYFKLDDATYSLLQHLYPYLQTAVFGNELVLHVNCSLLLITRYSPRSLWWFI